MLVELTGKVEKVWDVLNRVIWGMAVGNEGMEVDVPEDAVIAGAFEQTERPSVSYEISAEEMDVPEDVERGDTVVAGGSEQIIPSPTSNEITVEESGGNQEAEDKPSRVDTRMGDVGPSEGSGQIIRTPMSNEITNQQQLDTQAQEQLMREEQELAMQFNREQDENERTEKEERSRKETGTSDESPLPEQEELEKSTEEPVAEVVFAALRLPTGAATTTFGSQIPPVKLIKDNPFSSGTKSLSFGDLWT